MIPLPLIIDGRPVEKTLKIIERDKTWLEGELKRRGYGKLDEVFYAAMDANGTLWIDETDSPKKRDHDEKE